MAWHNNNPWTDVKTIESKEGNVWKYVFTKDDAVAESVLYRYPTFNERTVICCSTQSGCPVGCRFCGAGDKFIRSLSWEEIVSQVMYLLMDQSIDASQVERMQIMFMSMGEPMLNWPNLHKALVSLYMNYPKAKLLISTSGPKVDYTQLAHLSQTIKNIGLQFSVHESMDDARNALIPFKEKLTLAGIAEQGLKWYLATRRKPFFNYCAHEKNTTKEDVRRLKALFDPAVWECTVSVICERDESIAAANERQRSLASDFMQKMVNAGYSVRMFDPAGQDDIGGGCGQLWFVQDWMKKNEHLGRPTFPNLPIIHTPK